MTVKKIGILLVVTIALISCFNQPELTDRIFAQSDAQLRGMLTRIAKLQGLPRTTASDGQIYMVESHDWTSGFFPGVLWYQSEYTGDEFWQQQAIKYTEMLKKEQYNDSDHDIGFKIFCSYGNGYRLTKNPEYKEIIVSSAHTLAKRFHPKTGCIKSWDRWTFPVIIDNLMNLELLFWAAKATGDSSFYQIGYSHALITLKNHFRNDYSCYHLVEFDTITGEALHKKTYQGYADESSWARGQSWALYGMTMAYRETKDSVFLTQALGIADYIMSNKFMKADGVPYWDFHDPEIPKAPRDASAAAIICSAMYELQEYAPKKRKDEMLKFADHILSTLASEAYFAEIGYNNNFLLKHSTGFKPKNKEVDKPLIYADYYFLEAAIRRKRIGLVQE
ncbi:MAG: glycoside hydrolase family 88 protein [Marinifilaceae bacterium]|nr:glycoside hydrolase family 88 protein [Marinifilaceae bacterium]